MIASLRKNVGSGKILARPVKNLVSNHDMQPTLPSHFHFAPLRAPPQLFFHFQIFQICWPGTLGTILDCNQNTCIIYYVPVFSLY
jgi:hypothetical protein